MASAGTAVPSLPTPGPGKAAHRRQQRQVRDARTASPPSCRVSGYRNLPQSFRHLTKRSKDMKAVSFVWGRPWTSSLEGCHPFSVAAGCLDIVFVQPEHRDSPPEMNRGVPAWLRVCVEPPELATSPFPRAKPRGKQLHSPDSARRDHFLRRPTLANRCPG